MKVPLAIKGSLFAMIVPDGSTNLSFLIQITKEKTK